MERPNDHKHGDWLVHHYHGVGQLKGKEQKRIGGEESVYFRLEMEKGTIFVPEANLNGDWFRPVVSRDIVAEVTKLLARPAKKMNTSFLIRKTQINTALTENSFIEMARIVRDLYGRRRRRKTLSSTEDSLLRKMERRLLAEWTVASGLEEGEAEGKLSALLVKRS